MRITVEDRLSKFLSLRSGGDGEDGRGGRRVEGNVLHWLAACRSYCSDMALSRDAH